MCLRTEKQRLFWRHRNPLRRISPETSLNGDITMANYKTLNTVLAGALALGSACSTVQPIYHYNGKMGLEEVHFYETQEENEKPVNVLEVTRQDGTTIKMYDRDGNDLMVDDLEITNNGNTVKYTKNDLGRDIIQEAQKQFDAYVKEAKENTIQVIQKSGILMPLE